MSTAGETITTGAAPRAVAGVNDSASARAALRWAIGWAGHTGTRVVAIAVWEPLVPVVAGPEIGAGVLVASVPTDEQLQDQAGQWLDDAIAALPAGAEQLLDREVVRGDATTVLLDAARGAELLVVGNTRRGALAGALANSVAQRCVHHARCPLVLVPDPDDQDSM